MRHTLALVALLICGPAYAGPGSNPNARGIFGAKAVFCSFTGNTSDTIGRPRQDTFSIRRIMKLTRLVIFDGNSLTVGVGGYDYPSKVMDLLDDPRDRYWNLAVSGQTVFGMLSDAAATIDVLYDPAYESNTVVVWGGTNDLFLGTSADFVYNDIATYCLARKAAGFTVVILTILPRGGAPSGFETNRQSLNASIRSSWATFADGLADVAADGRIGDSGDELNTAYYFSDQTHLTDAGYTIIAKKVVDILNGPLLAVEEPRPLTFSLSQNVPNPFNPSTSITYTIPTTSVVKLTIYTIAGQQVATLVNEKKVAGTHTVQWKPEHLASGIFFCRLDAGSFTKTIRLVFLK